MGEEWSICPLCGQLMWPSDEYHEMHSWCAQFLSFLPPRIKVKVTFPKKEQAKIKGA